MNDSVTTIKIDYYEELKVKADKYDNGKIIIDMVENIIIRHAGFKNVPPLPVISYTEFNELRTQAKKQDPMKVVVRKFETFSASFCGSCEKTLWEGTTNYCYHCGQKLEWPV